MNVVVVFRLNPIEYDVYVIKTQGLNDEHTLSARSAELFP